ncbi:hypothetical protein BDR04DRAFT_1122588 [Suillus decipiens]|nr:hypothetical protein BDR04DRAFT_1122588 [Suillus decipiens]
MADFCPQHYLPVDYSDYSLVEDLKQLVFDPHGHDDGTVSRWRRAQQVTNFYYVAEELRDHMAELSFRTINEMVGRPDILKVDETLRTMETAHLSLSPVFQNQAYFRRMVEE